MKKPSLSDRIVTFLKKQDSFICGGTIQELALKAKYEPQNAGRRLRELVNDGTLEVEYRKGQNKQDVAWYRYKKQEVIKTIYEEVIVDGVLMVRPKQIKVLV